MFARWRRGASSLSLSCTHTHTHTRTLLTLTHSPTHTHALSLAFSLSFSPPHLHISFVRTRAPSTRFSSCPSPGHLCAREHTHRCGWLPHSRCLPLRPRATATAAVTCCRSQVAFGKLGSGSGEMEALVSGGNDKTICVWDRNKAAAAAERPDGSGNEGVLRAKLVRADARLPAGQNTRARTCPCAHACLRS